METAGNEQIEKSPPFVQTADFFLAQMIGNESNWNRFHLVPILGLLSAVNGQDLFFPGGKSTLVSSCFRKAHSLFQFGEAGS
jgi:hypothetical protein